jgi:hypothetical protein
MAPFIYLGLALAGGFALLKRSDHPAAVAATTDAALIDPSEKSHPNAEVARRAIVAAMHFNSLTLYENTAIAIEALKMPKTAANVRTWAQMAKSGGQTVAGDEFEIGADDWDEVGAARRVVKKLYAKHVAAKKKPRPRPKAKPKAQAKPARRPAPRRAPARTPPALSAPTPAPAALAAVETSPNEPTTPSAVLALASSPAAPASLAEWSSSPSDDGQSYDDDDAESYDDEAEGEGGEVGASSSKRLPDWLRFAATQSALAGDPALIEATATVMRRMGHHHHAAIHLRALEKGNKRAFTI